MFYLWERQGEYAASLVSVDTFVALGTATLPDAAVLTVAFCVAGHWDDAGSFAGSPWVSYPRATIAGLTDSSAGAVPSDMTEAVLPLPKLWGGVFDAALGKMGDGALLIAVRDATSFVQIPLVEVWHYRPMTTEEIIAALPMPALTAALSAEELYAAIGGAYSDAINRGVQPAPTAGRPAYVVINAPSS